MTCFSRSPRNPLFGMFLGFQAGGPGDSCKWALESQHLPLLPLFDRHPEGQILQGFLAPTRIGPAALPRELCFSDSFSRRFREGISFPNFVERSILKLPLSKICGVPSRLQNRALFEGGGGDRAKRCPKKGRRRGGQHRGKKEKRTRENKSVLDPPTPHNFWQCSFLIQQQRHDMHPTLTTDLCKIILSKLFCDKALKDLAAPKHGEHSGDHNHQDFPKGTAIQIGGVLQYKWEAYCHANGRSTDKISQMGGVLRYFLEKKWWLGFLTFF